MRGKGEALFATADLLTDPGEIKERHAGPPVRG
jgi:hypothetical protein